jgi:hypothetical protein
VARRAIATTATRIPLRMRAEGELLRESGVILTGMNTVISFLLLGPVLSQMKSLRLLAGPAKPQAAVFETLFSTSAARRS